MSLVIQLAADVADAVTEQADALGIEPDEAVDRILRVELLNGKNGIPYADLVGEEEPDDDRPRIMSPL